MSYLWMVVFDRSMLEKKSRIAEETAQSEEVINSDSKIDENK